MRSLEFLNLRESNDPASPVATDWNYQLGWCVALYSSPKQCIYPAKCLRVTNQLVDCFLAHFYSSSVEHQRVFAYNFLKYEKELNFVWRKIIQGVPSSVDERRQLQEISAAELQQFAITCVLGLWERKMVKTLVYIIKRKLQGALKIEIYFLVVKNNISLTQVKHLTPCRTTYLYLNYASVVKTPVS